MLKLINKHSCRMITLEKLESPEQKNKHFPFVLQKFVGSAKFGVFRLHSIVLAFSMDRSVSMAHEISTECH